MGLSDEHRQQAVQFRGRVMVAEDVRTNQILMASLLGKLGLEVTIAVDGREAVQKASSEAFDLIFMDIEMPNMDGCEATRTLRQQGTTVPVIALTGRAEGGDKAECLDAGCDDYLTKPVERERLIERLRKYLSVKEAPSHAPAESRGSWHGGQPFEEPASGNGFDGDAGEPPTLPVIDWDTLDSRGFDEALIESVMPICVEDNRKRLRELRAALKSQDVENVRLCAHAMKGSFAMMGVIPLAQAARSLEERAKQGDLSTAESLLSSMDKSLQSLESLVSRPGWVKMAKGQASVTGQPGTRSRTT
jgi:CheY-like chemotaxis protein/HPt (histidine-containing phosphotransfer) domain-containing protein